MKKIPILLFLIFTYGNLFSQTDTIKNQFDKNAAETSNYLNGLKFLLNGDTETAKFIFIDILSTNPRHDAAAFELARIYFMENNFIEASKYAEIAAGINPMNFYYQKLRLDIYQSAGDIDKSIALIKEIITLWPDKISMLHQYKKALIDSKRYKDALQVIDILISKNPSDEELVIEKFNVLRYLGNFKDAEKTLANFISTQPCNQKASLFLSNYYFDRNQDKKALKELESILACDSLDDIANLTLAEYYHKKGKRQETYKYLRKAFANPEVPVSSKMNYIVNLYPLENSQNDAELNRQLVDLVQIVAATHPGDPDAQRICGDVLYIETQFEKAAIFYEKLISLGSYQYQSVENLMICYYNLKREKDLYQLAKKASNEFPFQPLPHYFAGLGYFIDKNYELAIAEMEKTVKYGEESPELMKSAYASLGDLYGYIKDYDRSYEYYEKVITMDSLNALVLNNYAYSLAERNINLEKALKMSKKSLEIEEEQSSFLDTYGWVLFRLGRYEEALGYIERAIKTRASEDAILYEHYGDVLYKAGRKTEALEYWKKANSIGQGSSFLLKKIETGDYYDE
ncbi:MAG: tetratricopeptide repeat protein [Bacteroidales bacterium]|jgi:tetratricopeptide (TPR) repeat protein|nr:tetratricopeptide repeat protein [Bacteroidales bacterium]NPV35809.1 tetratricopeptide repeat protein [Bacteroidales bacterium]